MLLKISPVMIIEIISAQSYELSLYHLKVVKMVFHETNHFENNCHHRGV